MLAVVLIGAFMGLLDTTIVNVALPSMHVGIGASNTTMEWVLSGYALANGLLLIPGGRLGDNRGHRFTYICGLALFTVASLACGISQNSAELIISRVAQGVGVGIFFPAISGIIQITFSGRDRGKAFGMLGTVIGLGTALGPLLGGLLVESVGQQQGWRLVFLVNLPIAAVALPLAARVLPRRAAGAARQDTDPVGLALLTAGLLLLLLPLVEGEQLGWPLWTWLCLGASVVVLVGLWFWEVGVQRRGGDALIKPDLLRLPAFATGSVIALCYFAAFTSIFFTLSLVWQTGLAQGALVTGLIMTPFAVGSVIGAPNSSRMAARLGRNVLLLATGLATVGLGGIVLVLHFSGSTPSGWALVVPLLISGIGNGLFIAPNTDFVLSMVPRGEAATAGGTLNTAQRVGAAIGIAIIGTVLFGTLKPGRDGFAAAFVHSGLLAMTVNAGLMALAFVLILALPRAADKPARAAEGSWQK